ncbi:hypothetical protein IFM89_033626 [Coptis chinensis]|uniref:Uncharacterized protein n=1 Tax=Coptis chinensis TaxID=261450 RepID=A0A835LX81_9MAGN|nr:hypothetical protein IFM89_033626 [Coptis chinensis]
MPSIKIPKKEVERGRLYCKYYLVGKLDFNKIKLEEELIERPSNPTIPEVVDPEKSLEQESRMATALNNTYGNIREMNHAQNREEGTLQKEIFDAQDVIESSLALVIRNPEESIVAGYELTSRRAKVETTKLDSSIIPTSNRFRALEEADKLLNGN